MTLTRLRASVVVQSSDPRRAVRRFKQILGNDPIGEFRIPGSDLKVTAFGEISILSGPAESLATVRDLRATVFVSSLEQVRATLLETGWTTIGTLGSGPSLLARDPDGNLLEFVEQPAYDDPIRREK